MANFGALKQIDKALGKYYGALNRLYYDNSGGKFEQWFTANEFLEEDIEDELGDGAACNDCSYLEFDDNFPFTNNYLTERQQQEQIFRILKNCYKYGSWNYGELQVEAFLEAIHTTSNTYSQYSKSFIMNGYDSIDAILKIQNKEDLKHIVPLVGHRTIIMMRIRKLNEKDKEFTNTYTNILNRKSKSTEMQIPAFGKDIKQSTTALVSHNDTYDNSSSFYVPKGDKIYYNHVEKQMRSNHSAKHSKSNQWKHHRSPQGKFSQFMKRKAPAAFTWNIHPDPEDHYIPNRLIQIKDSIWYSTDFDKGEKGMASYCMPADWRSCVIEYYKHIKPAHHSICRYKDLIYIIDGVKGEISAFDPSKNRYIFNESGSDANH